MSRTPPKIRQMFLHKWWRWAVPLAVVVALGAGFSIGDDEKEAAAVKAESAVTAPVKRGEFIQEVIESGEVESSSNVEVRCEVDTPSGGLAILEIVPEGTYVEKGDFLVRLNSTELEDRLVGRQIDVNSSRAALAQAKADLEGARLALEEYKSGTFREQEEQLKSQEFVARENLRRAEEYLSYSTRLAEKGYVSEVQLEADRFAVDKAQKELEVAQTKLEVLRKFTREKMITQLEANIETSEARLSAAERSFKIDEEQLLDVKKQIEKCTIHAPTSGQVVYANKINSTEEPLIEEGKMVRENQEIVRLPDPKRMQVFTEVNESRIDLLDEGMTASIKIDALPDLELSGELVKVTEFPLPRNNRYTAHIKNYGATIEISDPPEGLKSGMTAEVAILVEKRADVMQVPVQAVFEREKRFFCLVKQDARAIDAREISIGAANENYIIVKDGLDVGSEVVLRPETYLENVTLPPATALAAEQVEDPDLVADTDSKDQNERPGKSRS